MISETVQVALITFASGAVGAIVGALGGIRAAKHTAQVQLQQAVLNEYFSARLTAFSGLYDAYEAFSKDDCTQNLIALLNAINRACMVASPETAKALEKFGAAVPIDNSEAERVSSFHSARIAAFHALDSDLHSFVMPKIITR